MSHSGDPFQAPEVDEQAIDKSVVLATGDYEISANAISCRDGAILPEVCIATGTTTDLQQREKTFYLSRFDLVPGWLPFLFLGSVVVFWVSDQVGNTPESVKQIIAIVVVASMAGLILALVIAAQPCLKLLAVLGWSQITPVRIRWYVGTRHLRRCRRLTWTVRALIVGFAFCVGFSFASEPLRDKLLVGSYMGLFGLLSFFWHTNPKLSFGGHDKKKADEGFCKLTGHHRHFVETCDQLNGRFS